MRRIGRLAQGGVAIECARSPHGRRSPPSSGATRSRHCRSRARRAGGSSAPMPTPSTVQRPSPQRSISGAQRGAGAARMEHILAFEQALDLGPPDGEQA